ncbi:MAG TPA: alpha-glucan family phosphorylase [Anaerolineae bacterium]|nr:alpha-glucan family phosphorylase [Anaerolineae bacterium]
MADLKPLKILIVASEASPYVKTGGIADVVSELARALKRMGHDVRIALPRYSVIQLNGVRRVVDSFPVNLDGISETISVAQGELDGVPVYFIENARLYDRDGIYMYPDDAERFLFFSRAALEMLPRLNWQPDVIHVNDWQTAIIPNWLKTIYANQQFYQRIASLYTIHNLAYFGTFGQRILEIAGLAQFGFIAHPAVSNQINGELNFMARGILFADAITTVSPTYAAEIQTPEFGEGLDPILRMRSSRLRGILNGIDYAQANPLADPAIASHFDADHLDARAPNKRALQQRADLDESDAPLFVMISRLNDNKGVDLVLQVIEPLLENGAQFVVMGTGEDKYQDALKALESKYPHRARFLETFNEPLRRQIVAGGDILLMPSRVEPGGTTQLLAMHYGCVPIVHEVGGLADSVRDYRPALQRGTGFVFPNADAPSLQGAISHALEVYQQPEEWRGLQQRGMRADFSWTHSAQEYVEMYEFAREEKHKVIEREATLAREIERTAHIMENLPPRIRALGDLVYNLWWSWNPDATALLERIDHLLWEQTGHNPIKMLRAISSERLRALAENADFLAHYDRVLQSFEDYMRREGTWFQATYPYCDEQSIAYFSAEFGIHESLPIYSGGLGILSGDHVKEASDMGVPLVGVGFLYPQGYFRQEIDAQGNQIARYDKLDFSEVPAVAAQDDSGADVIVSVDMPGRTVYAKVWLIKVGRVSLYLMDTDIELNAQHDRVLAARLYGGDHEIRIMQEIMLGIGGVRVLRALGLEPTAFHMNEGHSAFLVLELTRELVARGMSFDDAMKAVAAHSIFTTHTPIPAGNDAFGADLMDKYFGAFYSKLGISRERFLQLANENGLFSMTVLGLRFSNQRNGVSKIHGQVSRMMWARVFDTTVEQTPIGSITNGVHTATWLAADRRAFYDEILGKNWYAHLDDPQVWEPLKNAPNAQLWEIQKARKRALIAFARDVWTRQLKRNGADNAAIERARDVLHPDALTIGFARRFATYKRATLLLTNIERLKRILNHPDRPVQIIFAGKAHPADIPGQDFIRAVYHASLDPDLAGKLVLLEDYGIDDARMLAQGVDVWLNTPRRPLEASGTSGEKAGLNGVLNFSVLDGWWAEAYNGGNGWAIGDANREYGSDWEQDSADALSLYETLEKEIVPLYYERDGDGIPHGWLEKSKTSICTIAPLFSTRRMLKEYCVYYVRAITAAEMGPRVVKETMD